MIDGVLQCCFINVHSNEGGTNPSGWNAVACSDGVPIEVFKKCASYHLDDSSAQQCMGDKNDNGLDCFGIAGDGRYLYVTRLQQGQTDASGQKTLFSHTYVFPCTDELLRDPNQFINLSVSNFATSVEGAEEKRDMIAKGEELVLDGNLDIHHAIDASGIRSNKSLANLICAIYDQMTNSSAREPVCVSYHNEHQLQAMLYCIYTLLPLHLRRILDVISCDTFSIGKANVVFCHNAVGNFGVVLQPDHRSNIRRLGFVEHAALNVFKPGFVPCDYFDSLEAKASSLKIDSASAGSSQVALQYKIAHRLVTCPDVHTYSEGLLESSLEDALHLRSRGSDVLDEYVAAIVHGYVRNGSDLHRKGYYDELNEKLKNRHTSVLETAMVTYDAIEKLAQLEKGDRGQFDAYASELRNTDEGRAILDIYFERLIRTKKEQKQLSWEFLTTCYKESHDCAVRTKAAVKQSAWDLYCSSIKDMSSVLTAFKGYEEICRMTVSSEEIETVINNAKTEFWNNVNHEAIAVDYAETYKTMDDGGQIARVTLEKLSVLSSVVTEPEDVFLFRFHRYCVENHPLTQDKLETQRIAKFVDCIVSSYKGDDANIADWLILVSKIEHNQTLLRLLFVRALLCRQKMSFEEYAVLSDCIEAYVQVAKSERNWLMLRRESSNLFFAKCYLLDKNNNEPVPLDVWLRLGEVRFNSNDGGPFRVFSYDPNMKPRIIKMSPKTVVATSELIKNEYFVAHAQLYINSSGGSKYLSTNVRRAIILWLKEADRFKRADKRYKYYRNS